jgi:adenosylmethionine-8-amino-7-oxononanoate aminotransferase
MTLSEDQKNTFGIPTQHKTAATLLLLKGARRFALGRNKEYIDAIASWWVNPYGHSNKYIADAIYKQLTL